MLEVTLSLGGHVEDGLAGFAGCCATAGGVHRGDGLIVLADNLGLWDVLVGLRLVLDEVAVLGRYVGRGGDEVELALLRRRGLV